MSIAGFILIGTIITLFTIFAVVLAWGAHQTNSLPSPGARTGEADGAQPEETAARAVHSKAA